MPTYGKLNKSTWHIFLRNAVLLLKMSAPPAGTPVGLEVPAKDVARGKSKLKREEWNSSETKTLSRFRLLQCSLQLDLRPFHMGYPRAQASHL